jgi:hypothetical protein
MSFMNDEHTLYRKEISNRLCASTETKILNEDKHWIVKQVAK